jgi:hypothetical protein
MNKVVARFADGRLVKGQTADFVPTKRCFHIADAASAGLKPVEIQMEELKAVFFVKDLAGDPTRVDRNEFDPERPRTGRSIKVVFKDGEVLIGTTNGYQPNRAGFFLEPADPSSNTARCYVISAATKEITFV